MSRAVEGVASWLSERQGWARSDLRNDARYAQVGRGRGKEADKPGWQPGGRGKGKGGREEQPPQPPRPPRSGASKCLWDHGFIAHDKFIELRRRHEKDWGSACFNHVAQAKGCLPGDRCSKKHWSSIPAAWAKMATEVTGLPCK